MSKQSMMVGAVVVAVVSMYRGHPMGVVYFAGVATYVMYMVYAETSYIKRA